MPIWEGRTWRVRWWSVASARAPRMRLIGFWAMTDRDSSIAKESAANAPSPWCARQAAPPPSPIPPSRKSRLRSCVHCGMRVWRALKSSTAITNRRCRRNIWRSPRTSTWSLPRGATFMARRSHPVASWERRTWICACSASSNAARLSRGRYGSRMSEHRHRNVGDPPQGIEIHPEEDHPDRQQSQQHVVRAWNGDRRGSERLIEEHRSDDPRVVVERYRAVEHADDRERDLPGATAIDQRLEEVEFPDEAGQGRQPGQAEQEDGECDRRKRRPRGEAPVLEDRL